MELVRALATDALSVDNNGGVRLRGVTPKVREAASTKTVRPSKRALHGGGDAEAS